MVLTLLVSALALLGTTVAQATIPNIQKVTSSQWTALNSSVGGRLHIGRPLAAPCYSRYNGARNTQVNLTACKAIQKGKSDSSVLVDYIGGFQESQWAGCSTTGDKCPLSFALPIDPINPLLGDCRQGQVANYYIAVAGKEDVQAGLAFAQKHDVPIVIKNTGHDYKGMSEVFLLSRTAGVLTFPTQEGVRRRIRWLSGRIRTSHRSTSRRTLSLQAVDPQSATLSRGEQGKFVLSLLEKLH